jgi:hypothetical protein
VGADPAPLLVDAPHLRGIGESHETLVGNEELEVEHTDTSAIVAALEQVLDMVQVLQRLWREVATQPIKIGAEY